MFRVVLVVLKAGRRVSNLTKGTRIMSLASSRLSVITIVAGARGD